MIRHKMTCNGYELDDTVESTNMDTTTEFEPDVPVDNHNPIDNNVNVLHDNNEIVIPNDRPYIMMMFDTDKDKEEGAEDIDIGGREEGIIDDLILCENPTTYLSTVFPDYTSGNNDESQTMQPSDFDGIMNGMHNKLFFMQQHNDTNGGIRGIVKRAGCGSGLATNEEARIMFNILDNLLDMTVAERENYLLTIQLTMNMYTSSPQVNVEIPVSIQDANRLCLRNSNSCYANIPYEEPFELEGHACIRATDKLSTIFAKGTKLALLQDHNGKRNFDGFNGTPAAQELLINQRANLTSGDPDKTCFGYVMLWSDGYEQNHSRKRDGSMWLFLMRVCAPEGHSTSSDHIFCLAFGPSTLDHDPVIEHFLKEFKDMEKGVLRYSPELGFVNTSIGVVAYPCDLPERCKIRHTLYGGLYGKRSGCAGKTDPKCLPSCNLCFWSMIDMALYMADPSTHDEPPVIRECNRCCKFDHFTDSNAKYFDETEDTKYPTVSGESVSPPNGREAGISHLLTVKQSFPWLVEAVRFAYYNHSEGHWRYKHTVDAYLQSAAIDTDIQRRVYDAAQRHRITGTAVNESEYIPGLWQLGYSIDIFIEASMHLLGHGIISSVIDLTEAVFREHGIWNSFVGFAKPYLDDISSFRLDWCQVKSLPTSNWLAEDEFGFCRVMLFIYGNFIHQKNLQVSSPSNILESTLSSLKQLLCSCQVMVSLLMCKRTIPIARLDIHIKIFLDTCHRFCRVYCPTATEFWFTKINFTSLLNLPKQIAKFGHIGYTMESVFERAIQWYKPTLKSARRKNTKSLCNTMASLQKKSNLAYIRDGLFPERVMKDKPNRYHKVG